LTPEVNAAIIESEIDGGAFLRNLPAGKALKVTTKNRVYIIRKVGDDTLIQGHPEYCPVATKATIHGSTWGGSMIKIGFVGRGMHLEFSTVDHPGAVTTSKIQNVEEVA
jgi:hypothetical protein